MRGGEAAADEVGNDVLAEIVAGGRVADVAFELGIEEIGREDVNPHAGERPVGTAGHRRRLFRLFEEVPDLARGVDIHDAELRSLLDRHVDAGDRATGAAFDV